MSEKCCVIWWLRRDLRLADNPALHSALARKLPLLPVFILDDSLLQYTGASRKAFLFDALRSLDSELKRHGSGLVIRRGSPQQILPALTQACHAEAVFAAEDYTPYARKRDREVARCLGAPLHLLPDVTIHHPAGVVKSDGSPYTVFTPYSRAWKKLPVTYILEQDLRGNLPELPPTDSLGVPEERPLAGFPASEKEAGRRLECFMEGPISEYDVQRDRLDCEGTSVLSPYLHFGLLSAKRAAAAVYNTVLHASTKEDVKGCESWLNELIWREFYTAILFHYPAVLRQAFRPALREIGWRQAPADLQRWQQGETGFPVVDAAMRQLNETGWMHNRGRMISASFLVKDLLIDWQQGESWFMQQLADGDVAANNGGWQWTAGVGNDAAPYFRIFNPVLQGKKYDPEGHYIRRWVPELQAVPLKYLYEPWRMPPDVQCDRGCIIGKHYPEPMVDHREARQRALDAYQMARSVASGG